MLRFEEGTQENLDRNLQFLTVNRDAGRQIYVTCYLSLVRINRNIEIEIFIQEFKGMKPKFPDIETDTYAQVQRSSLYLMFQACGFLFTSL